ncbi:MAG: PEP-CTERM sorting domain-containing protein [Nitrosomonas sp.]|nr:PEP-CTERM sorting domain-containing protein [Nitrosomonas sp.]
MALPATAGDYKFTSFDFPDIYDTPAHYQFFSRFSINDSGQVAGTYNDSAGHPHGFLESAGSFTTLNPPGSTSTYATGINASGQIVGWYSDGVAGHGHVYYVYSGGSYATIDGPQGSYGRTAAVINDSGQIGLTYYTPPTNPDDYYGGYTTLIRSGSSDTIIRGNGREFHLTSINASGQLTGWEDQHSVAFVSLFYDGESVEVVDVGHSVNFAMGINDSGQIVGFFWDDLSLSAGYVYSGGSYTVLTAPESIFTYAVDINAGGQVVGFYGDSVGTHGFVYSGGLYSDLNAPGASQTFATGINDSGQIAGYYLDANGIYHGFTALPVPEPETYVMLLAGLGLLDFMARREKENAM